MGCILSSHYGAHADTSRFCLFYECLASAHIAIAGPLAQWILKFSTAGALVGLYGEHTPWHVMTRIEITMLMLLRLAPTLPAELQTQDVGLTEIVARVWTA